MEEMLVANTAGSSTQAGTYAHVWALQGDRIHSYREQQPWTTLVLLARFS